jgi:uncharacterized pyridoxamine 5'-phosphate oxidase family protein
MDYTLEEVFMEILNFEIEEDGIFNKIGKNKLAALATSNQDSPTVRMMSIIFFNKKIYFQTGIDLMKYKQISENKNVALCFENIQIEGIANIMGKPIEHNNIMEIYKEYYKNSFESYSKLDKEILIEVIPKKITKWEYDENGKPYRIFIELENRKAYKEMYLE